MQYYSGNLSLKDEIDTLTFSPSHNLTACTWTCYWLPVSLSDYNKIVSLSHCLTAKLTTSLTIWLHNWLPPSLSDSKINSLSHCRISKLTFLFPLKIDSFSHCMTTKLAPSLTVWLHNWLPLSLSGYTIDSLSHYMTTPLTTSLTVWLHNWLPLSQSDHTIDYLSHSMTTQLTTSLTVHINSLSHWLTVKLTHWLFHWLTYWLTVYLTSDAAGEGGQLWGPRQEISHDPSWLGQEIQEVRMHHKWKVILS